MRRRLAIGQALAVKASPLVNGVGQCCVATGQGHRRRVLGDVDSLGELLGFGQRGGQHVEGASFLAVGKLDCFVGQFDRAAIRRGPQGSGLVARIQAAGRSISTLSG